MLIPAQRLVDRLRQPRSRSEEIRELRHALRAGRRAKVCDEERARAVEMRRLKQQLSAVLDSVRSCSSCARGYPLPNGQWDGGNCCAGNTRSIFDDDELAALGLGGTTPARLRPPAGEHAGCAFRGSSGCSLEPADRPSLCARYLCGELMRELHERGILDPIEALSDRLGSVYQDFVRARKERLLDEALGTDLYSTSR